MGGDRREFIMRAGVEVGALMQKWMTLDGVVGGKEKF